MNCNQTEYAILDGQIGPEHKLHLRLCESCRQFQLAQQRIDSLCARAYAAPEISPYFRRNLDANIRRQKAPYAVSWLPALSGIVATALCLAVVPDLAGLVLRAGVGLTLLAYLGALAFEWLTEELGEA